MVDSIQTQVAYAPPEPGNKANSSEKTNNEFKLFGEDGLSFWDALDVINPLQHIPVVSTAYRALTGDELDPGARLAGGTLFGGPIGLLASGVNVLIEHNTGKDAGEHVLALFDGEEAPEQRETMVAQAQTGERTKIAPSNFGQIPNSEAAAFAAGEESLRLAALHERGHNPAAAIQQAPLPPAGAGSAGTWAPGPSPTELAPPTRRKPVQAEPEPELSPFQAMIEPARQSPVAQPQQVTKAKQYTGFQAKQTHEESISALQAFARDVTAQQAAEKARENTSAVPAQANVPAHPKAATVAQLNQTDSAWFADMMTQNMNRYSQSIPRQGS